MSTRPCPEIAHHAERMALASPLMARMEQAARSRPNRRKRWWHRAWAWLRRWIRG